MNKKEYLNKLRDELKSLPPHLIEDIIDDYAQHFDMAKEKGKTEEHIAQELGSPKDLAQEYILYYKEVKKDKKQGKVNLQNNDSWFETAIKVGFIVIMVYLLYKIIPLVLSATLNILHALLIIIGVVILLGIIASILTYFHLRDRVSAVKEGKIRFTDIFGNKDKKESINYFEEKYFNKDSISKIEIISSMEKINIISENRQNIEVSIQGQSSEIYESFEIEQKGSLLYIESHLRRLTLNNPTINMVITVKCPSDKLYDLKIKASMGSVVIKGDFNEQIIDASMGSLEIFGTQNYCDYQCSMGNIKLHDFDGYGNIRVSMGSCSFYNLKFKGTMEAKASLGKITHNIGISQNASENEKSIIFGNYNRILKVQCKMGNIKIES